MICIPEFDWLLAVPQFPVLNSCADSFSIAADDAMASTSSSVRKFASCDESDLQQIIDNSESSNTKKATKLAVSLFHQYKGENIVFEELSPGELNRVLGRFYVELRTPKGELYKKTTLLTYRQGIQRHLQDIRPTIDIIKGLEFVESNKFFKGK